jgi:hypothetical protein
VLLNNYQYLDVTASTLDQDPGQVGILASHWSNLGSDVDNLELVTEVIPEPTTLALLAAGGLATAVGSLRRRRRQ